MSYEQSLARGLVEELLEVIHSYDETLMYVTVIGAIETVKHQVLLDQMEFVEVDPDDFQEDDE
jgi:hypothetical protein